MLEKLYNDFYAGLRERRAQEAGAAHGASVTTGGSKIDESVDLDKRQLSRVEESLIDRSVELTKHSKSSKDRGSELGTEFRSIS